MTPKDTDREHPWAASYTVGTLAPEPSLLLRMDIDDGPYALVVETKAPVGTMTIELLDHHRRRVASTTRYVGKGTTKFDFTLPKASERLEGAHVQVGAFHDWILWGYNHGPYEQYGPVPAEPTDQ